MLSVFTFDDHITPASPATDTDSPLPNMFNYRAGAFFSRSTPAFLS